jgi:hypothetical protein
MTSSHLFGTGLARSGGGLYSMCLSTHPQMMVACCPNIELFRSYRNAMIRDLNDPALSAACPSNAPLQDWYGSVERITLLDHLLDKAHLDLPFDEAEWPTFLETSIRRGELETADLTVNYDRLKGKTYRDLFTNLLRIIADTRSCGDRKWVGLHETWILDFYPLLARSFPESRFLVMFRDPRATVSSMLGVENIDPSQVAQVLSYIRHWRKYAALALRFTNDPQFAGRLHITAHDLVLTQPQETLTDICRAFDLDLDARMLDTSNFFNYATGAIWSGNSSFEGKTEGISAHRALRWRDKLDPTILAAIEYLCGPDLKLLGYPTFTDFADPVKDADGAVINFLIKDHSGYVNWRSDLNDPLADLGLEAMRRQLLRLPTSSTDVALVRRTFLFEETYRALRTGAGPLLPALKQAL